MRFHMCFITPTTILGTEFCYGIHVADFNHDICRVTAPSAAGQSRQNSLPSGSVITM